MMADELIAIGDRLDRAEDHLNEIKGMLRAYYASDPYEARGEFDPSEKTSLVRLRINPLPVRCHTLIGELLHDLRSTLDHLACVFIQAGGDTSCEDTRFPICPSAPSPDANGVIPLPIGGPVSQEARALIEGAQPYTWGPNFFAHALWRLHRLAIIDRHRHIATKGAGLDSIFGSGEPIAKFTWSAHTISSDEWGAEIALRPDDPTVDVQGSGTLRVLVHEPGPAHIGVVNVPLLQALVDADAEVRKVIAAAKASCF